MELNRFSLDIFDIICIIGSMMRKVNDKKRKKKKKLSAIIVAINVICSGLLLCIENSNNGKCDRFIFITRTNMT